jgi:Ca2+-binding EF-hand superfamily protein
LHSKEFFYATQALGFNYSFVEVFEMYKQYDDNNSLRMNIEEFKRFYEAKLKDPESHVDPTKVSNVYNRNGSAGNYIHSTGNGTTLTTNTYTTGTTYTQQPVRASYTTTTATTGPRVVRAAPSTTYTTGTYATVNQEMAKYDTEGKGYITKEQLRVACQDLAVKCNTDQELNDIWNEIDTNGSGKVSGIEFGEFYDYVKGFRDEVRQYQAQHQ